MRHIASGYYSLVLKNLWPHRERSIAVMMIIKKCIFIVPFGTIFNERDI